MALKDLLSLVDDKLKETFHKITYDPAKDRAAMVKRIDATKSKFESGGGKGRKDYSISNDVVEYRPTFAGAPLKLDGKDALYVPTERFPDLLDHFKSAVEAGELDKQFEETPRLEKHSTAIKEAREPRVRMPGSGGGREWTPERRARFAASIAARNAAKDK